MDPTVIRYALIVAALVAIFISGIKRRPGVGIVVALVASGVVAWLSPEGLGAFGLDRPASWLNTIGLALLAATILALISLIVIEPMAERMTGVRHDISIVDGARGSFIGFLQWSALGWIFGGFMEEFIFRGYLQSEIARLAGSTQTATVVALLIASLAFGLSHLYQGSSGGISTSLIGLAIGALFIWSDYNLWLAIMVHGLFDTVQIGLVALNLDEPLRDWLIEPPPKELADPQS